MPGNGVREPIRPGSGEKPFLLVGAGIQRTQQPLEQLAPRRCAPAAFQARHEGRIQTRSGGDLLLQQAPAPPQLKKVLAEAGTGHKKCHRWRWAD